MLLNPAKQDMSSFQTALHGSLLRRISVQSRYNLIAREEEREMLPFCKSEGIALTSYSVLAGGRLSRPVVGATKTAHIDGAVKSVELTLTNDEIDYLEECYVPHALIGVMAQNGKQKGGNVV